MENEKKEHESKKFEKHEKVSAKKKAMAGKMPRVGSGFSAGEHNRRALKIERETGRDYHTGEKLEKGHYNK